MLSLNLRLNRIGDEGGRAVCDVLRVNSSLQRLNLGSNELGPNSALSLAALIGTNANVLEIDVTANNFGPEDGKQIREVSQHTPPLPGEPL